jgi:phosphonopyruvate decarboxylase
MSGISAESFLEPARKLGFRFWAGVPCSYLKPFINYIIDAKDLVYISSANEGDAVATASGAALAGQRAVVMMQNSGLGNAVSPLSSLNWVFRLPVLLIVTLRGDPEESDEPQHELMGQITSGLLDMLDIAWSWFPTREADVSGALDRATGHMDRTGLPFAFIMRKGAVRPHALRSHPGASQRAALDLENAAQADAARPSRRDVLEQVVAHTRVQDSIVIGSTGFNGRELFAIDDRPNHLYMVGSMGCAASLGLGLSLARPELHTVVCDGDGAALMRMGNLATVGAYAGQRFRHLLLDNGTHESTGGQATVSGNVRFTLAAQACGYGHTERYVGNGSIARFLGAAAGPGFMHIQTRPGVASDLPRPTLSPAGVKRRLMEHFGFNCAWRNAGA